MGMSNFFLSPQVKPDKYMIIYSTRYASVDSGHEDDMDDDTNQEEFPDVCLFSVAMMMMEKVIHYMLLSKEIGEIMRLILSIISDSKHIINYSGSKWKTCSKTSR